MANIIPTTATRIARIFASFTRTGRQQSPAQRSRWYDCEVSSRGL